MARLQWNPLPITDIGESALRAQAMAGASIQNAFSGITGALNQWEGARREDVLSDITRQQMSFSDPDAYRAALANGTINLQSDYLRPEDMMRVAGYQDTLAQRRNAEASFDREETQFGWRVDDRTRNENEREAFASASRAIAPHLAAALTSGDPAAALAARNEIIAANPDLSPQQMHTLLEQSIAAAASGRDLRSDNLNYRSSEYNFGRTLKTDREKDRAAVILNELTRDNIDGVSALTALNSDKYANESPEVVNAIRAAIPSMFTTLDNVTAPAGGFGGGIEAPAGGFAGGATDASRVMNYQARNGGFATVPPSVRTLGDASTFAIQVNRAGVPSSAMGIYQITGDTLRDFGPRVFGNNWQQVAYGPEAEDKIAEAIFNASKGSAASLRGRWVSLSAAEADRVRRLPWAEARRVIAAGESGARIPPATSAAAIRESQMSFSDGTAVGTDNGNGGNQTALAAGFLAASQRPDLDVNTVTAQLVGGTPGEDGKPGAPGVLGDFPAHRIRNDIRRLSNELGVAPSVAGWALAESLGTRNFFVRGFTGGPIEGPSYNNAKALIERTRGQDMRGQVQAVATNQEAQAMLAQAVAADAAARQQLAQAQARVEANGGRGDISRYVTAVQQTDAAVQAARGLATDPTIARPAGNRPPASEVPIPRSFVGPSAAQAGPLQRSLVGQPTPVFSGLSPAITPARRRPLRPIGTDFSYDAD